MPISTRQSSIIIGTGALLTELAMQLGDEEPQITAEGWDTLLQHWYIRTPNFTAEDCANLFITGSQLLGRNWWIQDSKPSPVAAGLWKADVTCKGWAKDKPVAIKVGSAAEQQQANNIEAPSAWDSFGDVTAYTNFAKVETHENTITVSASYLVPDITASGVSKSGLVGKKQTPPITIDVPPTIWAWLTIYVYHWPQGWVLMGSEQDRLPGCNAALVTDQYKYIRARSPG